MTYKTILVHLHDPERSDSLLKAAVPLARATNAHLEALCIIPPFVVLPAMDGGGASVTVDEHRDAYRADMDKLKAAFAAATSDLALPSEWREADAGFGTVGDVLVDVGRCADLIVASQSNAQWVNSSIMEDPVRAVMGSGRPVLLIPNAGQATMPPKRITVAWDRRREAARAVFDALPLLAAADAVNVVWIDAQKEPQRAGDVPGADICTSLARHGVKCQASSAKAADGDAGAELLRQAKAFKSDLLVMGCYGHSRFRELVLGGASRHILQQMSMPVLLAH